MVFLFYHPEMQLIGINWIFWDLFQWLLRAHPEERHLLSLLGDTVRGLLSIPTQLQGHPALLLGTQRFLWPWVDSRYLSSLTKLQTGPCGGAQEKLWCVLLPLDTSPLLCQWLTALSIPRCQPIPLCYSMLQLLLQENANDVSPDNLLSPQWAFHNGHLFQLN